MKEKPKLRIISNNIEAFKYVLDSLQKDEEARSKAKMIAAHCLGCGYSDIFIKANEPITEEQETAIIEAAEKARMGYPVQYALKSADFFLREFYVDERVLIPRGDTEVLCQQALEFIGDESLDVLDICTGSGAIGLTIADECENTKVTLSDISEDALDVARINAKKLGLEDIEFIKSDLFEEIEGKYDVITANPPYISPKEYAELDAIVKNYEPRLALEAQDDGLELYKRIAEKLDEHLADEGAFFAEIGYGQKEAVEKIFKGIGDIEWTKDIAGIFRVITVKKGKKDA